MSEGALPDRTWLVDRLRETPLVADGAMGTMLIAQGLAPAESSLTWNVHRSDEVASVHRAYVDAGAALVTANTFGGSPFSLARYGLEERTKELNAAGIAVARDAVDGRARVLGDVGPFGGFLEPYGDTTKRDLVGLFQRQIEAFFEAGADGVVLETMSDPAELCVAVQVAKIVADWPVIATYAFVYAGDLGFKTSMGASVEEAVKSAIDAGADVVGANCGTGLALDDCRLLTDEIVAFARDVPVTIQPNAGSPEAIGGRLVYSAVPEEMGALAWHLLDSGARIVGGCCGTTPEHIARMAEAVFEWRRGRLKP
jgi:5-methyltetrahydrofolate--homocysteine methyltransferase